VTTQSPVAANTLPRRSWVEQIMGMPISVLCRGADARGARVEAIARGVFEELRSIDAEFSPYRPDSAVARLQRGETTAEQSTGRLRAVVDRTERWPGLTGGRFDAHRPDGTWDPSGLVKGWAVERAAARLADACELDWCLNAGGDVLLHCAPGRSLVVGIAHPFDHGRVVASVALQAGALATSGIGARGAHIYDPALGAAAAGDLVSVTVTGPSLEAADVLATAAFVAGRGWRDLLAGFPGYAGLAIDRFGRIDHGPEWPPRKVPEAVSGLGNSGCP
jgi:thiamine biosynthesis lipoprotein